MEGGWFAYIRATRVAHAHARLWFYSYSNLIFDNMAKIPDSIVRHVQDVARIEDVVSVFVDLRKAGMNLTGLCPFHDDKHDGNFIVRPSTVSEQRGGNTFKCFVCEKKGGPVKFLMEHERLSFPDAIRWLGKKYSIEVDDVPVNWTPPPPRPKPSPLPRLTFKKQTVADSMKGVEQTLFVKWLRSLQWNDEQQARLTDVLRLYCVATCPHGSEWVAFWQITHDGVPLTAKYMKYKADGHRVQDRDEQGRRVFATDWEHAWRARQKQYNPDKWDTNSHALFGCHLLAKYPNAVVNLVESEKTALIMATYYGDFRQQIWLACGGLKFLQLSMLQPLIEQGRTIWLWPDKDGAEAWQQVADKIGYDRMNIYIGFFASCWTEADGDKADVADIAIRMMRTGDKPRHTTGEGQDTTEKSSTDTGQGGAPPVPVTCDSNDPFMDNEMLDPQVREWRMKMSRVHSSGWGKWPTCNVKDVHSVGEIISQHPILTKLLNNEQSETSTGRR